MSKTKKFPRTEVIESQVAALAQSEQLDEQALAQVNGGIRYLPMYGVPIYRKPHQFPFPFPRIPFTKF